ncbi:zinc-dependent alcohol dehydrogenase [Microbacter margulisiae]|uniref:L-iditol 2-dehydrogenase/threonine 3-dehydrogenase n=1 Tax=Microbacter margulisiae TaxID=1350067 RepID=A0A7W5DNK8_9PORP|nr:alcohol dehydrogenase catalytic domain-containing protein [Microbacter margulisiae]MBB3186209.1 L-iditol 2-dehydrogenase/threonine 3-dehydrogenase [Microbacter margulisiae]
MKQAIMIKPGSIEFRDVEAPCKLAPNEILLKIKRIGICGSDIHVFHGEHPATSYPVVQGHEYSATIEAVGEAVKTAKVGQRATARPQLVCGKCGPCLRGQYNACEELKVQGFQAPGVAQEYFIVPEDRLIVFPDSMSFEHGAMIEPAAVGAHSTSISRGLAGKNVVVSGAGTIGNLVAQFAKARGAKKVLITDISDFKLSKAHECGIENTLNILKTPFAEGIKDAFESEGYQVGFESAGVQASLDVLIANVEKGGEVIILGVYAKNPTVNMYFVGEHELNLFGSMMYRHEDYQEATSLISNGMIILEPLISKHFPFDQYLDAYNYIGESGDKVMKVMVDL